MDAVKLAYCEQPLSSAYVVPHPARPNEDTFCICSLRTGALGRASFFGVFDGHNGSEVSSFLASYLPQYVEACATSDPSLVSALNRAFQLADSALEDATLNCPNAGSTATVALLNAHDITIAHCGDSRALLCRGGKVCSLTEDHRPARPDERARVLGSGGHILWNEGERVMGVLATTRGFGDRDLKQFGVTAEPEVTTTARSADDEFLILATDGVFNVLSNEEVADVARRIVRRSAERGSPRPVAIRLASSAIARFSRDRNSRDDITVVVVDLASTGKRLNPVLSWEACQGAALAEDIQQRGLCCWTSKMGAAGDVMYVGTDRGRGKDSGKPEVAAGTGMRRDDTVGEQDRTPGMNILAAAAPVAAAAAAMRRWVSAPLCWGGGAEQWGKMDMHQQPHAPWVQHICMELPYADVTCAHPHGHVMRGEATESACMLDAVKATGPNCANLRMVTSGVAYDVMYDRTNGVTSGCNLSSGGIGAVVAPHHHDGRAASWSSDQALTVCTAPDDHPMGQHHDVMAACTMGQHPNEGPQPPQPTEPVLLESQCETWPPCTSVVHSQQPPCAADLHVPYASTQCTETDKAENFIAASPQSSAQSVPDVPCPPASPPPLLPRRASGKPPSPAPDEMMEIDGHDDVHDDAHSPAAPSAAPVAEVPGDSIVMGRGEVTDVATTGTAESSTGGWGCEEGNCRGIDDVAGNMQNHTAHNRATESSPVTKAPGVGTELGHKPKVSRTTSCAQEDAGSELLSVQEAPHQPLTQTQQQEGGEQVEERRQEQPQPPQGHRQLRQRHRSYTGMGMDSECSSFRSTRAANRAATRRASCMGMGMTPAAGGGAGGGGGGRISGPGSVESGMYVRSIYTKGHLGRGFGLSADGRVRTHTVSAPATLDSTLADLTTTVL